MSHRRPASSGRITILADNAINIFLSDRGPARYPKPGLLSGLLAQQGFSAWIESRDAGGRTSRILYDFGSGNMVVPHNANLLGIDLSQADALVLSHGHIDHYGGLKDISGLFPAGVPMYSQPEAFCVRGTRRGDGSIAGPWRLQRESAGLLDIREETGVLELGPGLETSGRVPRNSSIDRPFLPGVLFEGDKILPDTMIPDDQALFLLAPEGLVIITGCCHAGLFNTLDLARERFPGVPLHCLIGGLHLPHVDKRAATPIMDALRGYFPKYIVPLHCTGVTAQFCLQHVFPSAFLPGTVGMGLVFGE